MLTWQHGASLAETEAPADVLGRWWQAERTRWPLWLPVALGTGIVGYFAQSVEPSPAPAAALLIMTLALLAAIGRLAGHGTAREMVVAALILVAAVPAGLLLAQSRTARVEAPILQERRAYQLSGRVVNVEPRERGVRLIVDHLQLEGVDPAATPQRVRFTSRAVNPALKPGVRVSGRAVLMPPPGPTAPGAYDFARAMYFQRIGAVGFALGDLSLRGTAGRSAGDLGVRLTELRLTIAERVYASIGGEPGAVAAALLTGLRSRISTETYEAMRAAGLAHLLAISGLHVGLIGGTVFMVLKTLLSLWPAFALHYSARKAAALGAILAILAYTALAGGTVPTVRACLMGTIALGALLIERNPFSLRLWSVAACVVLLLWPESLLGPSFQMSFAAVLGLIAYYERPRPPLSGTLGFIPAYPRGLILTTVIATLATAPFALYHFQTLPLYGLLGNMIAVPLTGLLVMPAGLVALLLLPLGGGLADIPLWLMGQGLSVIVAAATWIAALPGAVQTLPQPPALSLVLASLGGLWLCLWRSGARRCGLGLIAAAILSAPLLRDPPDLLLSTEREAALRTDHGVRYLGGTRLSFTEARWLQQLGATEALPWIEAYTPEDGVICDDAGCVIARDGEAVSLVRRADAAAADCARSDLVIALTTDVVCPAGGALLNLDELTRAGGAVLRFAPLRVTTVRQTRGERPWVR